MSLDPLLQASPVIQIHAIAAIAAFAIGGVVLFRKKGTRTHKTLGRVWALLMVVTALSSFFVWELRMVGLFSPIHLLSIVVLVTLWQAIRHARARNIMAHKKLMQQLYIGALVIAGFFTFMPGRIMNRVLFGEGGADPLGSLLFFAGWAALVIAGYFLLRKPMGWHLKRLALRRA